MSEAACKAAICSTKAAQEAEEISKQMIEFNALSLLSMESTLSVVDYKIIIEKAELALRELRELRSKINDIGDKS